MEVKRKNILTGVVNVMNLDISQEQLDELNQPNYKRRLIQDIVPNLTIAEREFLISGITPEEWDDFFI